MAKTNHKVFEVLLTDACKFIIGTRPIRTVEWIGRVSLQRDARTGFTGIYRRGGRDFPSCQPLSTRMRDGAVGSPRSFTPICLTSISTAMRPISRGFHRHGELGVK